MATFIGSLLFAAPLALFFGFVIWLVPAMFFPDAMANRRPGVFGYLFTGYALLAVLCLYLVSSSDHDVAPLLGVVLSFGVVLFLRDRFRNRRAARSGRPSRWGSLLARFGLGPPPAGPGMYGEFDEEYFEPDDGGPNGGPNGGVDGGVDDWDRFGDPPPGRRRYGPTGNAPRRRPGDEGIPDTDPR